MTLHHYVEIVYRGRRESAEWYIDDGRIYVINQKGSKSEPVFDVGGAGGPRFPLPSETAERLLWELLRAQDPDRQFFYWRNEDPTAHYMVPPARGPIQREVLIGLLVLLILTIVAGVELTKRVREGRCEPAGRRGLDCSSSERMPSRP